MSKRIFIAFAKEDEWARDYLVGQAKNENSPFEFTDMSVKNPYDEKWRTQCRLRIKSCHGAIALVSKNTKNADGELWEIECCKDESVPVLGIYTTASDRPASLPSELSGVRVAGWTWANIENFINSL